MLTARAKSLLVVTIATLAIAFTPVRGAVADADTTAAVLANTVQDWAIWLAKKALTEAQHQLDRLMTHDSSRSVAQQIATNTLGVQQAIESAAAANVDAINQQSQNFLADKFQSMFGSYRQSVVVGGQRIKVGSNAPYACNRYANASVLDRGRDRINELTTESRDIASTYNQGRGSQTASVVYMENALKEQGPRIMDLSWLGRNAMAEEEVRRAWKATLFATNPTPAPPPKNADSLAGREYKALYTRQQQLMRIPQDALMRQANIRAKIPGDSGGRSYLQIVEEMAQKGVEDKLHPLALQAKTDTGVLRDIALSMSALLYVETERMKTEQENTAMLAILTSQELQKHEDALRERYGDTVIAD